MAIAFEVQISSHYSIFLRDCSFPMWYFITIIIYSFSANQTHEDIGNETSWSELVSIILIYPLIWCVLIPKNKRSGIWSKLCSGRMERVMVCVVIGSLVVSENQMLRAFFCSLNRCWAAGWSIMKRVCSHGRMGY